MLLVSLLVSAAKVSGYLLPHAADVPRKLQATSLGRLLAGWTCVKFSNVNVWGELRTAYIVEISYSSCDYIEYRISITILNENDFDSTKRYACPHCCERFMLT